MLARAFPAALAVLVLACGSSGGPGFSEVDAGGAGDAATQGSADASPEAGADATTADSAQAGHDAGSGADATFDSGAPPDAAGGLPPCPRTTALPPASCPPLPGAHYDLVGTTSQSPIDPATSPDVNLPFRSWQAATGQTAARTPISHPEDPRGSPQLDTLFADGHVPVFSSVYQVESWDWGSTSCAGWMVSPPVTLVGLATTQGTVLDLPASGYTIDPPDFGAMVIYATSDTITLKYTLDDDIGVKNGYAIQLTGVCVDPQLVTTYQSAAASTGRKQLPGLHRGQAWGYAAGAEIQVAVRDTGSWMDPRWCPDWWTCP